MIQRFVSLGGACSGELDNPIRHFKEHSHAVTTSESSDSLPLQMALNISSAVVKASYSYPGEQQHTGNKHMLDLKF